jgi:hypothetical protein
MAFPTKSIDYRIKYPRLDQPIQWRLGVFSIKKSVILMLMFWVLIFLSAFYYVEQQVRLQTLNYTIIELKKQKNALIEQRKTYQLQLHQLKRLDVIEKDMEKEGFVPAEEEQIRIVQ